MLPSGSGRAHGRRLIIEAFARDMEPSPVTSFSAGGPSGTPPMAPPAPTPVDVPRPTGRSRAVWAGVSAAVVVVVLVLAILGAGLWPANGPAGTPTPGAYEGTRGSAQSVADGAPGGPWTLYVAVGVAARGTGSEAVANVSQAISALGRSTCFFTPAASSSLVVPGVGNVSSGVASAWVYFFSNVSGSILLVSVVNAAATLEGTLSGSGCSFASTGVSPIPSSGLIDSTTASADAGGAGGWAFLANHPQSNATFVLIGGVTSGGVSSGPTWVVGFDSCARSGRGPTTAPSFLALISATTGSVLLAQTTTVPCPTTGTPGPTPVSLSSALALGTPAEAQRGANYWYNFSVQAASQGVTWANTSLSVYASGHPVSLASATGAVISLTGTTLATFGFATSSWSGASTGLVSSSEVLSVECGSSLSGDSLTVQGVGSFTGPVVIQIP